MGKLSLSLLCTAAGFAIATSAYARGGTYHHPEPYVVHPDSLRSQFLLVLTPTGCFPSAIRKTLERRFRWCAAAQKPRFCSQLFLHVVGRAKTPRTEQTRCLPERGKRSGATVLGGAPSKSKICEV